MCNIFKSQLIFVVGGIFLCGCTSRKGDYIQVLYEAKEFEKSLSHLHSAPDRKFLEELIAKVGTDGKSRWRISVDPSYYLETKNSYTNYLQRSSNKMVYYIITIKGKFICIDE